MFTKVIFVVTLAVVAAQDHHKGDDHGHAYSSQSFVLHQSHAAPVHHESHSLHADSHHEYHGHNEENHHGQHHDHHLEQHHDHHEESHQGYYGHPEVQHHGQQEAHHGHHEESHQGYGYHEQQHQEEQHQEEHHGLQADSQHGYYGHHEEQLHGHQEAHEHHGISSQNIHLHNDGHVTKHIEYYGHPKYDFAYEVKDPHTHDLKYQHESRDGDLVKGVYSLHQPDGTVRVVKYHADKKSGFNADVKYEGHAVHVVPEHKYHHH